MTGTRPHHKLPSTQLQLPQSQGCQRPLFQGRRQVIPFRSYRDSVHILILTETKATSTMRRDDFYEMSSQIIDDDSQENSTVISESMLDEDEIALQRSRAESRKRKRGSSAEYMNQSEYEHKNWAEALLDYFMLHDGDTPYTTRPPTPPHPFDVDRVIDNQGHTALHWAAAMGDIDTVKDLIQHGANLGVRNIRGETPLIRSAIFANCYEKGTMAKIASLLQSTILIPDRFEGTVLHHICHAASSCAKTQRARHYLDVIFAQLSEVTSPKDFTQFINKQDTQGDTAFHVAVRHSRRCTRAFQGIGAASDIENDEGITVNHVLKDRIKKQNKTQDLLSSSPIPSDGFHGSQIDLPKRLNGFPSFSNANDLQTDSARALSESFGQIGSQVFDILHAIEDESKEKDTALADARTLVQSSNDEHHLLTKQGYELAAELEESDDHDLQNSLADLRAQSLALEEQTQHANLHTAIRLAENKAIEDGAAAGGTHSGENTQTNGILSPPRSSNSPNEPKTPRSLPVESLSQQRVRTALELSQNQGIRRQLTLEVVDAGADAGFTERGEALMRLVSKALGKENAEVVGTVDEILEELEFGGGASIGVGEED